MSVPGGRGAGGCTMNISTAIVTGGAGFIGSHIVDELIRRKVETYVIDDLSTGKLENLSQHRGSDLLHVVIGDGRNIGKLLADAQTSTCSSTKRPSRTSC